MGYKLASDFQCNKIFLKEENRSWYHSRIEGFSSDIDDFIEKIKQFTDKFEPSNICFIGSSMGGYAALLVGTTLGVGKIIAFGPQIIINKSLPNNPSDDSDIKFRDLTPLINNSRCDIDIFIGVNELADLYQVKDIKECANVSVSRVFGQPHNVMSFLNKINVLKPYVKSKVFGGDFELAIHSVINNSFTKNRYLESAVELYYDKKDYQAAMGCFESLLSTYPSINTFWKFYGICLYHQNDFLSAIEALNKSTSICFSDDEAHYFLALIYFRQKDYQSASGEFTYAIDFSIEKKMTYYIKLAICLRELGEYTRALYILDASLAISRKNYGTYYQMALIYKMTNNIPAALMNMEKAGKLSSRKKVEVELNELRLMEKAL